MEPIDTGVAGDLKSCPACAESVKVDAVICRYCGHDFRSVVVALAAPSTPMPPPPILAYPRPARTNGFAIASLVLGILWLYWIGSILALIFGYLARGQVDASDGAEDGRGLAIAGIVLGWIGVGLLVLGIFATFVVSY